MLVGTDHPHYRAHPSYSKKTKDFDLRHGANYRSGSRLEYRTEKPYGPPITLAHDYEYRWAELPETHYIGKTLQFLLVEVTPDQDPAISPPQDVDVTAEVEEI